MRVHDHALGPSLVAVFVALAMVGPAVPAAADPTSTGPTLPGTWGGPAATSRYEAPVRGAVVRAFEPPATAFGHGHRGVDLAAAPHATVRAAADGQVTTAGPVAGTNWVSILHVDGIITTYGPLAALRTRRGDRVSRGEPIGTVAAGGHGDRGQDGGLHWGARIDSRYIDPLGLLDDGTPRPSLVGSGTWRGIDRAVTPYAPWEGGRAWGLLTSGSPLARGPGFVVPPNPNHLVLVPGLASTSETEVLDPGHLGYDPRSVTRFSYAGRRDGLGGPRDPQRDQLPHGPEHTWAGTEEAARTLAAQLRAQARREPGRPVDLVGHSMGGNVILRYLVDHHDPYDRALPPLGHVVTIASPLNGSDLASVGRMVRTSPLVGTGLGELQERGHLGGDHLPLDAVSVEELAVHSDGLRELAAAWERAVRDGVAGPLAMGTRVLNIGASLDPVVSSARTRQPTTSGDDRPNLPILREDVTWPYLNRLPDDVARATGADVTIDGEPVVDHRVLPGGHESVLDTEALREVTWRFLADQQLVEAPGHLSVTAGGELSNTARIAAEVHGIYGTILKAWRHREKGVPVDLG